MSKMWFLTSDYDHQRVIYLLPGKGELTIGRSPDPQICDFAIQDDPSISRKHVTLTASSDEGLFITDLDSRYGTFINNLKQDGKNKVKLSNGDIVKFGKLNCIWKVNEKSFVTCTSTMKGENIQNVKQNLAKIGGLLKNDWDSTCEYLTMPAITLTIKVVLALVQGSYIVTAEYWNQCVESINKNVRLPDPNKFTPEILESTLNKDIVSFLPNKNRANLFAGKKFVFLSKKQYDMYKNVLSKGSATPVLLEESDWPSLKQDDENMVVIQYNTGQDSEAQKKKIAEMLSFMKCIGKRVVADAEIGLAILYCSTYKYCNPAFNLPSEVVKQVPAQSSNKVLAQESQDQVVGKNKTNIVINESLTADENSSKRKLSEIDDEETSSNANKKVAHDIPKAKDSSKRKHDDEDDFNPSKKVAVEQDQDDFFNFITPATKDDAKSTDNRLNLAVPQKRKADFDTDENLFNFVEGEENKAKRTMFENNKTENKSPKIKAEPNVSAEDIAAMRGSKLDELNKDNLNFIQPNSIKKELDDELDDRMNQLDIGSIIVNIKTELIVKREPLEIEAQDTCVKNFKKFKKVWPLKMQVTVIPKSSMTMHSITIDDGEPAPVMQNIAMENNSA